jgi:hypothetical protein
VPDPSFCTVRVRWATNLAVTLRSEFTATAHLFPLTESQPIHPRNTYPGAAIGLRVSRSPSSELTLQVAPQSIPPGVLVTVPEPVFSTVSVFGPQMLRVSWGGASEASPSARWICSP